MAMLHPKPEAELAIRYSCAYKCPRVLTKRHLTLQMVLKGLGKGREECHRQGKGDFACCFTVMQQQIEEG